MTVNEEDTIVSALFSSSDELDSEYEATPAPFSSNDENDTNSEGELSEAQREDLSPVLGSVISTQTSLLGTDYYSDTSDSSTASI
jgi:hypothetical protein